MSPAKAKGNGKSIRKKVAKEMTAVLWLFYCQRQKTPTTIVQTNRIKESIKLHNETFSFSKDLENKGKVLEQFSMEKR